jgi:hypothetical protein
MPVIIWSLTNDAFFHTADGAISLTGSSPFTLDVNAEFNISLTNFVLSGGASNINSKFSLGGGPSAYPISGTNNNLFSDITEEDKRKGTITDFRCLYVFNDNATGTLYNASIFINSEIEGGSDIKLGVDFRKDTQRIVVTGTVSGGSFTIEYMSPGEEGYGSAVVEFNSNANIWAANLQKALNYASTELDGAIVTTEINASGGRVFTITFDGINANRFHENLRITQNSLTPGGSTITVVKALDGAPINSIAPAVDTPLVTPSGVNFFDTNSTNRLFVGSLRPGDGFPIWIKRVTTASSLSTESDGFTMGLSGIELKSRVISQELVWHLNAGVNTLNMDCLFQEIEETAPVVIDNTRVKRWNDLTPFRHNFIAAGPTGISQARPLWKSKGSSTDNFAKPAVWSAMDGSRGGPAFMYMQANTITGDKSQIAFPNGFHLFFVARRTAVNASLALIGNNTNAAAPFIAQVGSDGTGNLHFRALQGGNTDTSMIWPSDTTVSQILEIKRSPDGFVDAAFNGSSFTRLFSNTPQIGTFFFNRLFGHTGLDPWAGFLSEALAYNQALDVHDRSNQLSKLASEYSITLS